jgi:GNAT superfamily N-acetyltransferase
VGRRWPGGPEGDVHGSGRSGTALAYAGDQPVGWCAVEPRDAYPVILRSRVRQPIDARPAFAITCFYLMPRWRRKGLMRPLIEGAVELAQARGAELVEAYPLDPAPDARPSGAFTGIAKAFASCGFVEVARRSRIRPIMRRVLCR